MGYLVSLSTVKWTDQEGGWEGRRPAAIPGVGVCGSPGRLLGHPRQTIRNSGRWNGPVTPDATRTSLGPTTLLAFEGRNASDLPGTRAFYPEDTEEPGAS